MATYSIYAAEGAVSKAEAVRFCEKQEYDLIVLDVNFPDGNGFVFCSGIKEHRPGTAVIFLTAHDMESDQIKGFELGAEGYVTKPFPMSVFLKKIAALLARILKRNGGGCYNDGYGSRKTCILYPWVYCQKVVRPLF